MGDTGKIIEFFYKKIVMFLEKCEKVPKYAKFIVDF